MQIELVLKSLKFIAIAIIAILAFIMILAFGNLKAELRAKEYENATLLQSLKKQNEAINNLKLDIKAYQDKKPIIEERIITKYKTLQIPQDSSCEARLKNIQNKIKLWYGIKEE